MTEYNTENALTCVASRKYNGLMIFFLCREITSYSYSSLAATTTISLSISTNNSPMNEEEGGSDTEETEKVFYYVSEDTMV